MKRIRILCLALALMLCAASFEAAFAKNAAPATEVLPLVLDKATRVTLSEKKKTLNAGDTLQLIATVSPSGAPEEVRWSSNRWSVAKVDEDGLVTALSKGTATITAKTLDGKKKATCKITVKVPVTGFSLKQPMLALVKGKSKKLGWTFEPNYASNKKLVWKSSNKSVATVSSKGVVKARRLGSCTISATTKDGGFVGTCQVSVVKNNKLIKDYMPSAPTGPLVEDDLTFTLNGITIPMTRITFEELVALFPGASVDHSTFKQNGRKIKYDYLGYQGSSFEFYSDGGHRFGTHNYKRASGGVGVVSDSPNVVVTARGIVHGSTLDDVIQAYGVPHVKFGRDDSYPYQLMYFVRVGNRDHMMVFHIDVTLEHVVQIEILLNSGPASEWR